MGSHISINAKWKPEIDAPTLLIHGSSDKTVAVEENVERYEKLQANKVISNLEILEGGTRILYEYG